MYNTYVWLRILRRLGFSLKRARGGHARFARGNVNIDVPVHQKELSRTVVANIRKAIRAACGEEALAG